MKTYQTKKLGEALDYEQPGEYIVNSKDYSDNYKIPVLTAGKTFILGNTNEKENIFPIDKLPVIIFDDFTTAIKFVDFPFKVKSSAMKILHAKKNVADIKYLFYLMQTIEINHATHKRYWISEYSQIKISLPPLAEQKKIVAKLEKVLGKIKEAKKLRSEAEETTKNLIPAELHKIFEEGKKKGWEEKKLGDETILKMTSGGTPSRSNIDFYNGGILWLKSGELENNVDIIDSEEKISEDAIKKSSAKVFPKGTVLFAMYGATAGKLGILGIDASTNQAVAGMIPVAEKLNNKFLYYFLLKQREEIISQAWGGAQPNLSQAIIKEFKISLPSLPEQKKIVVRLDLLSEKIKKLQDYQKSTKSDMASLEQSILSSAFSGKLDK
ncbi:MAG: restriction endonuclease subunit S [Candidatus Paceibacterota bacterium]|jgi:type I restriction enzyme S subunit